VGSADDTDLDLTKSPGHWWRCCRSADSEQPLAGTSGAVRNVRKSTPKEAGRNGKETMKDRHKRLKPKAIMGERLYLRPYRKEDLKFMLKWMNDKEILGLTGEVKPWSKRDLDRFYDRVKNEKDRAWFSIVLKDGDRVIGETGLLRAFWPWRGTDLTIEINEKDVWNQGYGTEAMNLLLSWAFDTLGFHRVSIGVVGFNKRALHFYEKNGFRREGVFRDGYLYGGKYHDFIMMSILEHEFRERRHMLSTGS
jgi:RimJ/RimL family protein N-acetyltransferase